MTNKRVVLLCENNHHDPLILLSKMGIYNKLDKVVWRNAFVESSRPWVLEKYVNILEDIDSILQKSYFLNGSMKFISQETSKLLFPVVVHIDNLQVNKLNPIYFDPDNGEMIESINLCGDIESMKSEYIDSYLASFFKGIISSCELEIKSKRNKEIVQALKEGIEEVSEKSIGSVGQYHCVDLYHDLKKENSTLLEEIQFLNVDSNYISKEDLVNIEYKDALYMYLFRGCLKEFESSGIEEKLDSVKVFMMQKSSERLAVEKEFVNDPDVLNIEISVTGGEGTIHPHDLADHPIFN